MTFRHNEKHARPFPNARQIRRACNKELYRAQKRLNIWVPPEQISKAEQYYFQKVLANLPWIVENESNRKKLADWWAEHVAPHIAELWGVESSKLERAFRDAFGG